MSSSDEPVAESSPGAPSPGAPRQRVVRVRGARRAQLTPVPGTDPDPEMPGSSGTADGAAASAGGEGGASGPNDERMRRDVPPHY